MYSESLLSHPLFSVFLESRFCKRRSFFHSVWCLPGYSNLTQRCRNSELLHGSPSSPNTVWLYQPYISIISNINPFDTLENCWYIHRSSCWPSVFSQVDSRAPSIAWTGDLKRFVNLDPEDASEGSDEVMIEKTWKNAIRTYGGYGLGI